MIRSFWLALVSALGAPGISEAQAPGPRIAVIGGRGMIGRRVVDEALSRGYRVTVVARGGAPSDVDPRVVVRNADVLDSAGLANAVAGHDAIVSAVGTARSANPDYSIYRRSAETLIAVLRGLTPPRPRLVVVGGVGSLHSPDGRLMLELAPPARLGEHRGQQAALEFYRTITDVEWTYVSPPGQIAPGVRTGRYRTGADTLVVDSAGVNRISMEDYAVAILDEIEGWRWVSKRFTVGY